MGNTYEPKEKLEDYRIYLLKKILRLKSVLDRGYQRNDFDTTIETLRQLEADLFKLKNVGTLIDMRAAA